MNEPSVWGQAFPDIVQFDDQGFGANHKKIHNVYGLEMARATFDGIKTNILNVRPFILTRAGYAGIQRYAAVWTGDNRANDVHLEMACTITQSMGLSGIPFVGSDVGGFIGVPSANLYTRWMELGAFTPFFRGHSEINVKDKEPWAFGDEVEGWVKKAIELRYKLLPYLYNEFYKASITGLPIMRPMFLDFQDDEQCYTTDAEFQFMLGNEILVAPVLNENDVYKKLYLPEGKWLELQTNQIYNGNQWVVVEAPINRIPFFIKEGGIVPMQEVQNYVGEKKITELKLYIFPSGNSSSYELYEDDGKTLDYQNGDYSLTKFEVTRSNGLDIGITKEKDNYSTGRKDYLIMIYDADQFSKVSSGSSLLQPVGSLNNLENSGEGYFYDTGKKILTIKVIDTGNLKIMCR
jgi:alpha-glucosidase